VSEDRAPCYKGDGCAHMRSVPGDAHKRCNCHTAVVEVDEYGVRNGWCLWPLNFDPIWILECDSFSSDESDRKASIKKLDPLVEIMGILKGRL